MKRNRVTADQHGLRRATELMRRQGETDVSGLPRSSPTATATIRTVRVAASTTIASTERARTRPTATDTGRTDHSANERSVRPIDEHPRDLLSIDFTDSFLGIGTMLEIHESKTRWIRRDPHLENAPRRSTLFLAGECAPTSLITPYFVNTRSTSLREIPAAKSETCTR